MVLGRKKRKKTRRHQMEEEKKHSKTPPYPTSNVRLGSCPLFRYHLPFLRTVHPCFTKSHSLLFHCSMTAHRAVKKVVNDGNTIWKQQSEIFFSIPELVCEKHRTISFKDEELK
jgi:hypothetical protein